MIDFQKSFLFGTVNSAKYTLNKPSNFSLNLSHVSAVFGFIMKHPTISGPLLYIAEEGSLAYLVLEGNSLYRGFMHDSLKLLPIDHYKVLDIYRIEPDKIEIAQAINKIGIEFYIKGRYEVFRRRIRR